MCHQGTRRGLATRDYIAPVFAKHCILQHLYGGRLSEGEEFHAAFGWLLQHGSTWYVNVPPSLRNLVSVFNHIR